MSLLIVVMSLLVRAESTTESLVRDELQGRYAGAVIALGPIQWTRGAPVDRPLSAQYLGDDGRGSATFKVHGRSEVNVLESECRVNFSAMTRVPFAKKRFSPGNILSQDDIEIREINTAVNPIRQYRDILSAPNLPWSGYEARAVVIENQPILRTQIDRVPLIRAGASVKIKIISNHLTVWTRGILQEAGGLNQEVRVVTVPQKRNLSAVVRGADTVEVNL